MGRSRRIIHHQAPILEADPQRRALRTGDRVRMEYPRGTVQHGVVDTHTPGHSVVWVHLDRGQGRTMLLAQDQVEITPALSHS